MCVFLFLRTTPDINNFQKTMFVDIKKTNIKISISLILVNSVLMIYILYTKLTPPPQMVRFNVASKKPLTPPWVNQGKKKNSRTTSWVNKVKKEILPTTSWVNKVKKEIPPTTSWVNKVKKEIPPTTSWVNKVKKEIPPTTSLVNKVKKEIPPPTSWVNKVKKEIPPTTSWVNKVENEIPPTTSWVNKVKKEISPPTSWVNKVENEIPPTTSLVNKVKKKMPIKYVSRIDFDWLSKNPIYSNFKINQTKTKKRVTLLVIVSTAPRRVDRRNTIRSTWWKLCKQTGEVR